MTTDQRRAIEKALREGDKRRAAVHESGHATIASLLTKGRIGARIFEIPTDDPINQKTWSGSTECNILGLSAGKIATIAIAGDVAEGIARGVNDADEFLEHFESEGGEEDYPLTEMAHLGMSRSGHRAAAKRAFELLRANRDEFEAIADELTTNGSMERQGTGGPR